jgi:large subunit ribosomal protein L22
MEIKATSKDTGVTQRKVRRHINMVRGMMVTEAIQILKFTPSPIAKLVEKTVKSAAANAENNYHMNPNELRIIKIYADEAKTQKRWRPRARGRMAAILKRSSHLTVIVADTEA